MDLPVYKRPEQQCLGFFVKGFTSFKWIYFNNFIGLNRENLNFKFLK